MEPIPVFAFAAYSGVGKTTLIERIIRILKEKQLRVAVIKHDAHEYEIDHEGKDSWRFAHAGADITVIGSPAKTAYIEKREQSVWEIIDGIENVDLILIEGFKNERLPQIGICRKESGKGFTADLSRYIAVVTDDDTIETNLPCFGLDDARGVAAFIMEKMKQ